MAWSERPSADPLWAYHLHAWEWAWPALVAATPQVAGPSGLLALMTDWIDTHPIGKGIAWEPYPTSRRLVVWSAAWVRLDQPIALAESILQQARFLSDHLEWDLANNHLIANAKALAWVGILLNGLPDAEKWPPSSLT